MKKPNKTILGLSIIFCSLYVSFFGNFIVPARASPYTWVVDQTIDPAASIAEAIDNAAAGDTILILNGTYHERLLVSKSVSLVGENSTIDADKNGTVISITTNDVRVEGLTITGSGTRSYDSGIFIAEHVSGGYIINNTIIGNYDGVSLHSSGNNVISYNTIKNNLAGITIGSSSNNAISYNTITNNYGGISFHHYSTNNTILGNTVSSNTFGGISLHHYSTNNAISHNTITNNDEGISLYHYSSNNKISYNIIKNNLAGVTIGTSNNNTIIGNTISSSNWAGVTLDSSGHNKISFNAVTKNYQGINLKLSSNNTLYFNNLNNTIQAWFDPVNGSLNVWDNGKEGNFWSNYNGTDFYSGPFLPQNETGSDGIGDSPFTIDGNKQDRRPLMGPVSCFDVTLQKETYSIVTVCNSTISELKFEVRPETGGKIVRFTVTGKDDTTGFCRIIIPVELVDYPYFVWIDTEEIVPTRLNTSGEQHVCLYFNYTHESQTVTIASSKTLNLYNQLLAECERLETDLLKLSELHSQLQDDYINLANNHTELQNSHNNLNNSYNQLQDNYINLANNHTELQNSHNNLNNSYNQLLEDYSQKVENIQSLIYIFAAVAAVFIVTATYLSKSAHSRKAKTPSGI